VRHSRAPVERTSDEPRPTRSAFESRPFPAQPQKVDAGDDPDLFQAYLERRPVQPAASQLAAPQLATPQLATPQRGVPQHGAAPVHGGPPVVQRCTDELIELLQRLFKKPVTRDDVRVVDDDRSSANCHSYALKNIPIPTLLKFTFSLRTDLIEYGERHNYDTVIAAFSTDGFSFDHTARWDKTQDEVVHKLTDYPYFACDPLTYKRLMNASDLWFFGLPKQKETVISQRPKRRRNPREMRELRRRKREMAEAALSDDEHDMFQVQEDMNQSGSVTNVTETTEATEPPQPTATLKENAQLRADDTKKTKLRKLKKGQIVTIRDSNKPSSYFSLGGILSSYRRAGHYWVETADGTQGWVRQNALSLG